jgi:hypothetical protein
LGTGLVQIMSQTLDLAIDLTQGLVQVIHSGPQGDQFRIKPGILDLDRFAGAARLQDNCPDLAQFPLKPHHAALGRGRVLLSTRRGGKTNPQASG